MSLLKYNEYLTEKVVYTLLLESKLVFSKKFINILSNMKSNKLASELLDIYGKDVDGIRNNFIEVTDQKDTVSFIPDTKAQEIVKDKPDTYKVVDSGKYLTHSDRNNKIFETLGYNKEGRQLWIPEAGTTGLILNETISSVSGKTYVLFQEYNDDSPRLSVLNKVAVVPSIGEDQRLWTTSRNNIKVGRLVRAILKVAGVEFIDKDIEEFTNQYKATFDFMSDALKQFDIVSGKLIAHWYYEDQYVGGGGSLNNSCMANVDSDYFDIYSHNPNQCSLVILYSDDGEINDGKYTSNQIKGRALLWTGNLDGQPVKFMDRIYTVNDSDVELFKQFAEKNGWWYKSEQSMYPHTKQTNGKITKSGIFEVNLDDGDWPYYPYMDTLCFLDTDTDILSNNKEGYYNRVFRDTSGEYHDYYDD
jgi:hypothetical protein